MKYNFNELIANALDNNLLLKSETATTAQSIPTLLQGSDKVAKEVKIFQPIAHYARVPLILENYKEDKGLTAAYSFSKLADDKPKIEKYFIGNPTSFAVQKDWELILKCSTATSKFTQSQLADAKRYFEDTVKRAEYNHTWHKTEAVREDWYDAILDIDNLTPLILSIPEVEAQQSINNSSFITMESAYMPEWNTQNGNVAISDKSKIKTITVKVLVVTIIRDWFLDNFVSRPDWCTDGIEEGHFSTGTLENNSGCFPLLPTHLIIAGKTEIDAFWAKSDEKLIKENPNSVSLDSFLLGSESESLSIEKLEGGMTRLSSTTPYVLGYISKLMPKCPPMSGINHEV